jgi:catechol-2,3-dioxygenase
LPKVENSSGLHHIAFTFPTLSDLLLAYRQRKAKGILPTWSVNHGPTVSLYYQDPDGNSLETQVDTFDTPDEATAFMKSEKFAENPIGTDIDPVCCSQCLAPNLRAVAISRGTGAMLT